MLYCEIQFIHHIDSWPDQTSAVQIRGPCSGQCSTRMSYFMSVESLPLHINSVLAVKMCLIT